MYEMWETTQTRIKSSNLQWSKVVGKGVYVKLNYWSTEHAGWHAHKELWLWMGLPHWTCPPRAPACGGATFIPPLL